MNLILNRTYRARNGSTHKIVKESAPGLFRDRNNYPYLADGTFSTDEVPGMPFPKEQDLIEEVPDGTKGTRAA